MFRILKHRTLENTFGRIIQVSPPDDNFIIKETPVPELFDSEAMLIDFKVDYPEISFDDYELITVELKQVR